MNKAPYWRTDEIEILQRLKAEGRTFAEIAVAVGRTESACQLKAFKMRLLGATVIREYANWPTSPVETLEFARSWHGPATIGALALRYKCREYDVKNHARALGLGPRKDPRPDYESMHWYSPAKPRLRLCYCCDSRLPQGDFDGPDARVCIECANPETHAIPDLPIVRDCWDEDRAIGGGR